jgi:glycosyltransferase involved in cell wall biosynthesis
MKVLITIPAYNAAEHLEEAIESVLNQTHPDFELLVINDGSQDETAVILDRLSEKDKRIRVIHQENQGIAETLNRALSETDSEWVFIMHADDVMLPERLARQLAFIEENPELRVCSCLAYYISESGQQLGKTSSDLFSREKLDWYVKNNEMIGLLHPGAALHRSTVLEIGGYRQAFWPSEDVDLWNRMAEKGHLIQVQNEVLMKYRIHTGSASTSKFIFNRMKYEWARSCMRARRNGKSEPDWETFQNQWHSLSLLSRWNRDRKIHAKRYYHEAGHDCLRKDYFRGFAKLTLAAMLQPVYVLPRLKDQVFK